VLADWAAPILETVDSYAETSPSGMGVKLFFLILSEEVRGFLDQIGVLSDSYGCRRAVPGHDSRDHGPAIEVYLASRYFAITEAHWPDTPEAIRVLDEDTLNALVELIPPPANASSIRTGGDTSRSATAFRKGCAAKRGGKTYNQWVTGMHADPETSEWTREKGEPHGQRELRRIWAKAAPEDDALPTITVRAGLRHEVADAGLAALDAAGTAFYQRGEQIVRVLAIPAKTADGTETTAPGIVTVTPAFLGRELGRAARWEGCNRKGDRIRIDPPRGVVEQIAEMAGEWPFSILAGVIATPTIRPNGSLLLTEGYDHQTGLVLLGAPEMPLIPEEPTRADAEHALQLLDGLLAEFPFRDGGKTNSIDRAVALSKLLTPVLRGAMPTAPMHLANAPQPGTGKYPILPTLLPPSRPASAAPSSRSHQSPRKPRNGSTAPHSAGTRSSPSTMPAARSKATCSASSPNGRCYSSGRSERARWCRRQIPSPSSRMATMLKSRPT
jgi:hypothetical protein